MNSMPCCAAAAPLAAESVQRELPPSMIVSPSSSSSNSSWIDCWVGAPDGIISQTWRGFSSFQTRAGSDSAPPPPRFNPSSLGSPAAARAELHRLLDRLGRHVPADDLVVRVAQDAMDHVAAHLPEPYEADLHQDIISLILA